MNTGHYPSDEQLRTINLIRGDLNKPPLTRDECNARWKGSPWPERRETIAFINRYVRNGFVLKERPPAHGKEEPC